MHHFVFSKVCFMYILILGVFILKKTQTNPNKMAQNWVFLLSVVYFIKIMLNIFCPSRKPLSLLYGWAEKRIILGIHFHSVYISAVTKHSGKSVELFDLRSVMAGGGSSVLCSIDSVQCQMWSLHLGFWSSAVAGLFQLWEEQQSQICF